MDKFSLEGVYAGKMEKQREKINSLKGKFRALSQRIRSEEEDNIREHQKLYGMQKQLQIAQHSPEKAGRSGKSQSKGMKASRGSKRDNNEREMVVLERTLKNQRIYWKKQEME